MPIEVVWDNEDRTIIRVTFPEQWTWDDFLLIDRVTGEMLDTVYHKVCYLADVSRTKRIPSGLRLETARFVLDFKHENSDLLVIFGMSKMISALLNVVLMALGKVRTRIEIVESMDEAYKRIHFRLLEIRRYGG